MGGNRRGIGFETVAGMGGGLSYKDSLVDIPGTISRDKTRSSRYRLLFSGGILCETKLNAYRYAVAEAKSASSTICRRTCRADAVRNIGQACGQVHISAGSSPFGEPEHPTNMRPALKVSRNRGEKASLPLPPCLFTGTFSTSSRCSLKYVTV